MCILIPVHLDTSIFPVHFFFLFNNLCLIILRKLLFGLVVGFVCLFHLFGMVCPPPVQMLLRCFMWFWVVEAFFLFLPCASYPPALTYCYQKAWKCNLSKDWKKNVLFRLQKRRQKRHDKSYLVCERTDYNTKTSFVSVGGGTRSKGGEWLE